MKSAFMNKRSLLCFNKYEHRSKEMDSYSIYIYIYVCGLWYYRMQNLGVKNWKNIFSTFLRCGRGAGEEWYEWVGQNEEQMTLYYAKWMKPVIYSVRLKIEHEYDCTCLEIQRKVFTYYDKGTINGKRYWGQSRTSYIKKMISNTGLTNCK